MTLFRPAARRLGAGFSGAVLSGASALILSLCLGPAPVQAQTQAQGTGFAIIPVAVTTEAGAAVRAFRTALAEAAAEDEAIAAFFRDRAYAPFWTDAAGAARRTALLSALSGAQAHGLPVGRYDPAALIAAFRAARTEGDRGRLEVTMTRAMLDYARDVQTGALVPSRVDEGIKRVVPVRDRRGNLDAFAAAATPETFLKSLPPASQEYAQLMKARFQLERAAASGAWGPKIESRGIDPGATGPAVIALRERLIAMGYLGRSETAVYDAAMVAAVRRFQTDHGLEPTGTANAGTIAEINTPPEARLTAILVAMERERWLNVERGKRHIWVNLTDFSAKIIDNGKVTFTTRAVIGAGTDDKLTPEFSDRMTYMELNPDWTVPPGIIRRDYLPKLKANPNALSHLQLIDRRGQVVPRSAVNFAALSDRNFPYNLRQPPGAGNALGRVKFMFPNAYSIYLHDTPDKHLFARETRAYSSGCVRLNDPFDFAYELLSRQEADPKAAFHRVLDTKQQSRITLAEPVPIHLEYRTAFSDAKGRMQYRRDVYGRDARIFAALKRAGLVTGLSDS